MTRETPFDRSITTSDAFSRTLRELLLAAHENDVEVSGAWECRSNGSAPDWETVITELAKEDGTRGVDGGDGVDGAHGAHGVDGAGSTDGE